MRSAVKTNQTSRERTQPSGGRVPAGNSSSRGLQHTCESGHTSLLRIHSIAGRPSKCTSSILLVLDLLFESFGKASRPL